MSELHGRDVAVSILNNFYDRRGIFEENRIVPELVKEELEALELVSEEEKKEAIEKSDSLREIIISAIRRKTIEFNEETGGFEYKLQYPPLQDGVPKIEVVKFVSRYNGQTLVNNTRGLKEKDIVEQGFAIVACRCGVSRLMFQSFCNEDIEVCQAVAAIYARR